jgi:hypothetical protein
VRLALFVAAVDDLTRLILAAATPVILPALASAHEVRPAYLELTETAPGAFDVLFKTPMQGKLRLSVGVSFSGRTEKASPVVSRPTGDAMVQTWRVRSIEPLTTPFE